MSPQDLSDFKKDVRRLYHALDKIAKVWPSNKMTMLSVLVQNLQFESAGVNDYSHEKDMERTEVIMDAIKELAECDSNDYVAGWINDEIHLIYEGYFYNYIMEENER